MTPGKGTQYSSYRRLGGPQDRSARVRKISPPLEFVPQTFKHAVTILDVMKLRNYFSDDVKKDGPNETEVSLMQQYL